MAAKEEVMLLDWWASPFAMRVRIALAEKGVEFETREEDLCNKSPLLLEMNPVHKVVPVLIHNGKPIYESLVIVQYVDEVWKENKKGSPPLLPSDPYDCARARFWADFVDKKIYSIGKLLLTTTGKEQEAAKNQLIECFKLLEGELGEKTYFGGQTLGLVDVALIPFYSRLYAFETFGSFTMEKECPKLLAWGKRCLERVSVSKTMPDQYKIYELFVERRKKLGVAR